MKYVQVRIVIIVDYSSAYVHLEYSRDFWIVYCEPTAGISHLVKTGLDWTGLQSRRSKNSDEDAYTYTGFVLTVNG